MKINSCKELAHRVDHSKPKQYSLCPHRLQPTRNSSTVALYPECMSNKTYWIDDCAETHLFPSQKI